MTALWSGYKVVQTVSYETTEAITQWYAVKLASDTTVSYTDTQGEKVLGIAMETVASGAMLKILVIGECPVVVKTAASFARGDSWTASANSTDQGKVEEAAGSDYVGGYLLDAPAADDDQVMAFVDCSRHVIQA